MNSLSNMDFLIMLRRAVSGLQSGWLSLSNTARLVAQCSARQNGVVNDILTVIFGRSLKAAGLFIERTR